MGKLVGLLSSGISLAIEAASDYQSSNKSAKRSNSHYQHDMTYGSRDVYMHDNQAQQDAKAFQDLQSYADFQRVLSDRVQDDILKDEKYTPIDPRMLPQKQGVGEYFSHEPYIHPSLQHSNFPGRLPGPVIVPQRRPKDKSQGWVRAYNPTLMNCGIDEHTFLNFLDAFNESSQSSPYLDVVNLTGFGVGFASGITPMLVSMAVPVAVENAKSTEIGTRTTSFLTRANNELFVPHGLFAMVMTYDSSSTALIHTVDISHSASYGITSPSSHRAERPTSAPFTRSENNPTQSLGQQKKSEQIGHFIADNSDRRAQVRYALDHPFTSLASLSPTLRSRWGDPNNPDKIGGLSSLLTSTPRRDDQTNTRRHRRRKGGSSRKSPREEGEQQSGLISGNGGDEGRNDEPGLKSGIEGIPMEDDILYLMIINNPTNSEPSAFYNQSPADSQTSYPYRETKRVKSPGFLESSPFQQREFWSPALEIEGLARDRYPQAAGYQSTPGNRERSPPPAYDSPRRGGREGSRFEKRTRLEEYCVPTL